MTSTVAHVDYPHKPGTLHDCPACLSRCHCAVGNAECVRVGQHNGNAYPPTFNAWQADRPVQNETYGEVTRGELAEMRANAQPCLTCGMLATVDPVFHASRYGHAPVISRDGITFTWSAGRHGWLFSKPAD